MHAERKKLSVPQVSRQFGVANGKVLAWIKTGELAAINGATKRGGRPRYLIDLAAIEAFERGRAVTPPAAPTPRSRRKTVGQNVTEFF